MAVSALARTMTWHPSSPTPRSALRPQMKAAFWEYGAHLASTQEDARTGKAGKDFGGRAGGEVRAVGRNLEVYPEGRAGQKPG